MEELGRGRRGLGVGAPLDMGIRGLGVGRLTDKAGMGGCRWKAGGGGLQGMPALEGIGWLRAAALAPADRMQRMVEAGAG
jgi:hypothetical protein